MTVAWQGLAEELLRRRGFAVNDQQTEIDGHTDLEM